MNIQLNREENSLTVVVKGRLDTVTSPELKTALEGELDGVTALCLDLSALEYISSAGLRQVLTLHKRMAASGTMILRGVRPAVQEVFDMTGFADFLKFEPSPA